MNYISTRSSMKATATQAILQGLSPDGGLYIPETIVPLDLLQLTNDDYPTIAFKVLSNYFTDIPRDVLQNSLEIAYSKKNFKTSQITNIKTFGTLSFLELYHGQTCAFKDMALSLFPHLVKASQKVQKSQEELFILTATSGDTGKAAMEAIANHPGISIAVLYPVYGVSHLQKLQMQTQLGNNVFALAIDGNFDDAQRAVKTAFSSDKFLEELQRKNLKLSSANSINIARLLPQTVYYVDLYIRLVRNHTIQMGDPINLSIPTGNFGNLLAAYLAKQMGVAIDEIICASNENNVLTDFIGSGVFDISNRSFHKTHSPSMDILIPSNLERYLYYLSNDSKQVSDWMDQLKKNFSFEISRELHNKLSAELCAYFTSNIETVNAVKKAYDSYHYLIDPHTAVAYDGALKHSNKNNNHTVVISTASPYKFIDVYRELFTLPEDDFEAMSTLSKITETSVPENLSRLKQAAIRFNQSIDKNNIETALINYLRGLQDEA